MRLLVLLVAMFACACATDRGYGAMTTTWDAASSNEPTSSKAGDAGSIDAPTTGSPTTGSSNTASAKKVTAKEAAESWRTGGECIRRATIEYARSAPTGEALLKGCAEREDAIELDAVLHGPWTNELKDSEAFQVIVAELIAHRGGFVEADTKAARAAGVPIYDVTSAMTLGAKGVGRIVVVRGTVAKVTSEKWGKGKSDVASIAESSWADDTGDETGGVIPVRDAPEPTGLQVFARLVDVRPNAARPLVAALRLESTRDYTVHGGDNDGDDVKSLIGVGVGFWETGAHLRQ